MKNKQAEREAFFDLYKKAKEEGQAFWQTDYYREHYWEEKKKQYERGQDFINTIQSGETYKIERYVYTDLSPYALDEHSDITEKKVIKIYAVNKGNGAAWFTTTTGEAIEADTIIKWERLQTQQELEF